MIIIRFECGYFHVLVCDILSFVEKRPVKNPKPAPPYKYQKSQNAQSQQPEESATFAALSRNFGGPHRQRKTPEGKQPTSPEKNTFTRKRLKGDGKTEGKNMMVYRCDIDIISMLYRFYIDVISILYRCGIDFISM